MTQKNLKLLTKIDENGLTALHQIAQLEAEKKISPAEIEKLTRDLFTQNADIHAIDKNGETPFNIAAPASPIIGRLMTNFWLSEKSSKALDETSGSHNSTLAQYIAKWSNAKEIDAQLDFLLSKNINITTQNGSGWTPLHAACAMLSRTHAVSAFSARYTNAQLNLKTSESYQTRYNESPEIIFYDKNLTAAQITESRLAQAKTLPKQLKTELENYLIILQKAALKK